MLTHSLEMVAKKADTNCNAEWREGGREGERGIDRRTTQELPQYLSLEF